MAPSHFALMLIIILRNVTSQNDICVWGALNHTSLLNGQYTPIGTVNGKPYYRTSPPVPCRLQYYLFVDSYHGDWQISNVVDNSQYVIYCDLSDVLFNCTSWSDFSLTTTKGDEPRIEDERELLKDWLSQKVRLPQYYDALVDNGYDTLDIIKEITDEKELTAIGIDLKGHVMKLMKEIQRLGSTSLYEVNKPFIMGLCGCVFSCNVYHMVFGFVSVTGN
eukprot:41078_1